jgi:hypothetical protein
MCGEPVLQDLDAEPRPRRGESRRQHRQA